jgi:hypothetical protein
MKIENLRTENYASRTRVVATVIWEDRDRPNQDLYFETTKEFAGDISCNPNAFLTACVLPAMRYGEKRIAIDAPICPELKDGITTAMRCLIQWHGGKRQLIPIEAPLQSRVSSVPTRAGCLFSGGIDSLAMVRNNRLNFPSEHPRSFKDGILVYGVLNKEDDDNKDPSFKYIIDAVSAIADDAKLNLIPIYTNAYAHIRDLDLDFQFWKLEFHGSFLAAVAHTLTNRLTTVSIASSSYTLASINPWGSHPLLDSCFSSTDLHIRHEDAALSRLAKTQLVAEWDAALKNLRVCNEKSSYLEGNYNCGKCEKCLRTMVAFMVLGVLEQIPTFKEKNVSKDLLLKAAYIGDPYEEACYRELIAPLEQIHRYDLVDAVKKIIKRYHEQDFKGFVKRADRNFLGGNLVNRKKKTAAFL